MERKGKQGNWRVKIVGTVFVLRPLLSSPSALLRWFLNWRAMQILVPAYLRHAEAMSKAADAFANFGKAIKEAHLEALNPGSRDEDLSR